MVFSISTPRRDRALAYRHTIWFTMNATGRSGNQGFYGCYGGGRLDTWDWWL